MGLVLKHIERTAAGGFQYRRRVPKDVASVITKAMIKKKLGDTEKEALAAWPKVHAQVEREIAAARHRLALSSSASSSEASNREAYAEALRRRADLVERGASEDDLALTGETMLDSLPQEDWVPVEVPPVERHTINCQSARKTDPLSASKFDPPCGVEIRA